MSSTCQKVSQNTISRRFFIVLLFYNFSYLKLFLEYFFKTFIILPPLQKFKFRSHASINENYPLEGIAVSLNSYKYMIINYLNKNK